MINCKCYPKWGLDDLVSFPTLGGTEEFARDVVFLMDIKKRSYRQKRGAFEEKGRGTDPHEPHP